MEELIKLSEKYKAEGKLENQDFEFLKSYSGIKSNQEILNLIDSLQNSRSINLAGKQSIVLEKLLDENNISISDDASVKVALINDGDSVECENQDLVIVDKLEKIIKTSSKLEPLERYTTKFLEPYNCKNVVAISLELVRVLQENDAEEWEERFDDLDSKRPDRDIKIYSNKAEVFKRISYELVKKEQINYTKLYECLDSIITDNNSKEFINEVRAKYQKENNYKKRYQQKKQKLITIAKDLSTKLQDESIKKMMLDIVKQLETQEFSIGITGIIKAGKSTMLNALLKKDILGTAIRPETANLTVIKKASSPKAIVHFWSEDEWIEIKNNALDEQAKEFVQTSQELSQFKNYINAQSKSLEIDVDKLDNYTSARKSDGVCNLVKEVELQLDLDFLDDGVMIVDTPGINDPVVQREIITKKYLESCSAILHLMSAKQSATRKDIEFIGDALLDNGISSILVVLTRIDTLGSSKEEIDDEVVKLISYTKKSIEKYIIKRSEDDKSELLSKIEYLPIAGKFALQHRIGESEKALQKGYELKDTGILEIENYIDAMLFGAKNKRAKIAIQNAISQISISIDNYNEKLESEFALIGLDKEKIDEKLNQVAIEKEEASKQLDEISKEIQREEVSLRRTLRQAKSNFESEFDTFRINLSDEISEYIINTLYQKEKPDEEMIKTQVETELKKFVSKIANHYQQKAEETLENSIEYMDAQYSKMALSKNIDVDVNLKIDKISAMDDFTDVAVMMGVGGLLGYGGAALLGPIGWIGAAALTFFAGKKIDENRLEKIRNEVNTKMIQVNSKLQEINNTIHQNMLQKLEEYDNEIISNFKQVAMQPAIELENSMQEKEKVLKELQQNLITQEKSDDELKVNIEIQNEAMQQNLNLLEGVKNG